VTALHATRHYCTEPWPSLCSADRVRIGRPRGGLCLTDLVGKDRVGAARLGNFHEVKRFADLMTVDGLKAPRGAPGLALRISAYMAADGGRGKDKTRLDSTRLGPARVCPLLRKSNAVSHTAQWHSPLTG
jgi:hypothetical protein